jgi:GH15 family glucan-1,4-alpha-glucosidase
MRATVAALREELGCPAGSLRRYAGDTYAGGNRWVLAALWLGLWYRQVGEGAGLERALTYALSAQTKLGLLPEQVTDDGEPAWVVPLAWSHAMLLLAARPELTWPNTQGLTLRDGGVTTA